MACEANLSGLPLRVLVAEDSDDDAFLLTRAFRKAGIGNPVHVCRDGQETIDYLSGAEKFQDRTAYPLPTMLLLDLKMPKVSGFEVLEWLEHHEALRELRAAVLSSSDHPSDMKRACELGAWFYFVKPATPEGLVEMARQVQENWSSPKPAYAQPESQAAA